VQWRNPVMFVVYVGSIFTTLLACRPWVARARPAACSSSRRAVAVVHRAVRQLRRGLAEGRSKAQAASLRGLKQTGWAKKLQQPRHGGMAAAGGAALRKATWCWSRPAT
jgi:K+-transporting ATPase ATPase B chain